MRTARRLGFLVGGISLLGSLVGCGEEEPPETDLEQAALGSLSPVDSWVAVFEPGTAPGTRAAALARTHGLAVGHVYRHALLGFSFQAPPAAARAVAASPGVAYVLPDGIAHAIAPKWCEPGSTNPACSKEDDGGGDEVVPWGVTRVGGPRAAPAGRRAFVLDTGIDLDHPDLDVNVSLSENFVPRGRSSPDDGHGHGTHVAGTIGAIDNDIDVVGVAAGAELVAVRVLDSGGSGLYSWIIAGVDYVASVGASGDVANMSLAGPAYLPLDQAIINTAAGGVRFTLAAGNAGDWAGDTSPARANGTNVFTVSAIGVTDCLASWSNWGNPPVDVAAPGVSILSTKRGGGTTTMSGTSMAAPHVAGILLVGALGSDGTACADPDEEPDPIAHY